MAGLRGNGWTHHREAEQRRRLYPMAFKTVVVALVILYVIFALHFPITSETTSDYSQSKGILSMLSSGKTSSSLHEKEKVVAYVISVTADGPYMDGAAVLAHGIRKAVAKSKYRAELVAIIFPNVTSSRAPLERSGWKLIERDLPVKIEEIEGDYLREHIVKNGCCGATELLKLYAWMLTDYHRVVHLDMDSMVLQPMDELFDLDKEFIYTCDYALMTKGSAACPVQGGFFVLWPNKKDFEGLVEIVKKGDYRGDGTAWGGEKIGWFWGGMTIQGLLPYYFLRVKDPETSLEANRCIYNNMFDNPGCKNTSVSLIKNVHFTVCQKPWSCYHHDRNLACQLFLDKWYELRQEVEFEETGSLVESCIGGKYQPIAFLQKLQKPSFRNR